MLKICLINVKDTSSAQMKEIIKIKQQAWDYADDRQLKWIKENLKENDEHVLLFADDVLCAYMNLVNVRIIVDGKEYDAIGVGNVCVAKNKRGMNYGALLLHSVNTVIKERDSVGILLCKDALTGFYRKAGWNEIGKDVSITVAGKDFCNHAFIYNLSEMPVRQLQTDISF